MSDTTMFVQRNPAASLLLGVLLIAGCASKTPIDQVDLMPAPDVYGDGMLNPLPMESPFTKIPYGGILYATDRKPATDEDPEKFYLNDRGQLLRVGVAEIILGEKQFSWERAREISLLKTRTDKYPLKVNNADEWGILNATIPRFLSIEAESGTLPSDATQRFTDAINAQLAISKRKMVTIYVHGYKVVYENPVLVSSELWHFLGYDGAFIAYAWPSTPSKFAYIKDSDTSSGFARNLRILLETIAAQTDVEAINVIGYSNGTRLVLRSLEQLALIHNGKPREEILATTKLRDIILVGSDIDRGVFGSYIADGLLDASEHLTIYLSNYDKALGVSQFLTRRQRLGQMFGSQGGELAPSVNQWVRDNNDRMSLINVSDAEGAGIGNGHGYFRSSPWASSDVLMTLIYGLRPNQRGLIAQEDYPVYTFPPDYISRLWDAIEQEDPAFAESYREYKAAQAQTAQSQ